MALYIEPKRRLTSLQYWREAVRDDVEDIRASAEIGTVSNESRERLRMHFALYRNEQRVIREEGKQIFGAAK